MKEPVGPPAARQPGAVCAIRRCGRGVLLKRRRPPFWSIDMGILSFDLENSAKYGLKGSSCFPNRSHSQISDLRGHLVFGIEEFTQVRTNGNT
jgi:hypothetical protein